MVYEYEYTMAEVSHNGVVVSNSPNTTPLYEVPQDAVVWGSVFIKLPADTVRVAQLQRKLEEYKQRLEAEKKRGDNYGDTMCKISVLSTLLTDHQASFDEVRSKLEIAGESVYRLEVAFHVISDYCFTGGEHVFGGTGLPLPPRQ
jgi:hypothetical protein